VRAAFGGYLFALFGLSLSACTTVATGGSDVSEIDYKGAIPDRLPTAEEPLGFLTPYADPVRDDVTVTVKPYVVTGSTPDAILYEDDGLLSKFSHKGRAFIARVDWTVDWSFDYETDDDLCRAKNVQTDLTVNYILPDWQPAKAVGDGLRRYWDAFEEALWVHEYGHALIGYETKKDIQAELSDAEISETSCRQLGRTLNAKAKALVERGQDAAYDAVTDHGATQGAVFYLGDAKNAARTKPSGAHKKTDTRDTALAKKKVPS
jgi:predicted secreted Zn-dependent protease